MRGNLVADSAHDSCVVHGVVHLKGGDDGGGEGASATEGMSRGGIMPERAVLQGSGLPPP